MATGGSNVGSAVASSSNSDPTLTLPTSEEVTAASTTDISGITYTDSFAQSNPGDMYLQIDDTSGTLSATDSSGTVSGSGTDSILLSAPYPDIVEALDSLTYVAPASAGSDTINFDIWDQAGSETTGVIPVGIAAAGGGTTDTWTGAVSGDWNVAGNWSGATVPSSNDTAIIPGRVQNVPTLTSQSPVGETIVLTGGVTGDVVAGELDLSGSTINSLLEAQGVGNATVTSITVARTWTIGSVGTVTSGANSILTVYGPEQSVQNNGLLIGAAGGTLELIAGPPAAQSHSTLTNSGSIIANGGSVYIGSISGIPGALPDWDIRNTGTFVTENGGALSVNGTIDGGQIVFNGSASLTLEQPQALIGAATVNDFSPGDQIDLIGSAYGTITGFSGNELEIGTAGSIERIPFVGGFGLGNFEDETTATNAGTTSIIAFAYPGMANGITNPDIAAPAVDTVAHGATLSLGSVSVTYMNGGTIDNAGSISLAIDAESGTLYMNGATGSGTNQISTGTISVAQANADLATLNYVPAAGAQSDTVSIDAAATSSQTMRSIPITVAGTVTSGPTLTEPSSETVSANTAVAISGSYADSFAQGNPGDLFLGISDSSGTLTATDASGNPVAGSGTNNIALSTDYTDLNAVLDSLRYMAGANAGSDTISFDVWNQAGTETTASVPVTVSGTSAGATETWTGAVSGDWNTPGNWSGDAVPTSGDTAVIAPSATTAPSLSNATLTGETIILGSSSATGPSVFFNGVTLGAGTTLESTGSGGSVGDTGTLSVAAGATIAAHGAPLGISSTSSSPATLVNDGTIVNAGSGEVALNAVVENNGAIIDSDPVGGMSIGDGGSILNSGTITDQGGLIILDGAVLGGTVAFAGSGGTLLLGVLNPFAQGAIVTGVGQGDRMVLGAFSPTGMSFNGGTLELSGGSFGEAIPFAGTLGLGNFELNNTTPGANGATTATVLYAASGGAAGTASGEPDITAPGTASVAQGGTLALNDVSIANAPTLALDITASSGTLYMNGASGSGTNHLTIAANTPESQINADLASLTYVPAAATTSDTIEMSASAPFSVTGTTDTIRYIPVTISGSTGPTLTEPSSETVAAGGTVAVSGSYSDSFAQGNPGDLFLGISDNSGTLSAADASGNPVTGSGSNSIALSTDYADLNAALESLTYTAAANGGSTDDVHFDIWNQAGVETAGDTTVAIGTAPINATTMGTPNRPTFIAGPTTATQPQTDLSQIASLGSLDMAANDLSMATGSGMASGSGLMPPPDTLTAATSAFLPNLPNDHPTLAGVVVPSH